MHLRGSTLCNYVNWTWPLVGCQVSLFTRRRSDSPAITGEVVSASAFPGDTLAGKTVDIESKGVMGKQVRSGWINIYPPVATLTDLVPGKSVDLKLEGVSFWINDNGNNWLSFEVSKVLLDNQEVTAKTGIEQISPTVNRPYILINAKYRVVVTLLDLETISFAVMPSKPSVPSGLTATPDDASVHLKWSDIEGATSYVVYRAETSEGEGVSEYARTTASSFTDGALINGHSYYYTIAAANAGGTSSQSSEVNAIPQVPAPQAPQELTVAIGKGKITLAWPATPGATSYIVYRSKRAGGEGTIPYGKSATPSFTDRQVVPGVHFYYQVVAINAGGTSPRSDEIKAFMKSQ